MALIWLYAATAGLSPSVVRAALMFTALQFALASGRSYLSVNILAGTAFVMLLTDPDQLFDLSFQLSFTAQNALVRWAAALPGGAVEWQAPKAAMWVAYLLFIAVTLMLWSAEREKTVPLSR